jgi:hypothetical protein
MGRAVLQGKANAGVGSCWTVSGEVGSRKLQPVARQIGMYAQDAHQVKFVQPRAKFKYIGAVLRINFKSFEQEPNPNLKKKN